MGAGHIVLDNGPSLAAHSKRRRMRTNVTLCFIRPGKPIGNAYVESFNGKFRDGCRTSTGLSISPTLISPTLRRRTKLGDSTTRPSGHIVRLLIKRRTILPCPLRGLGGCRRARLTESPKSGGTLTLRVAENESRSIPTISLRPNCNHSLSGGPLQTKTLR